MPHPTAPPDAIQRTGGINAELVDLTVKLGLPRMEPASVRKLRRQRGDEGARAHIEALAAIVAQLRAAGLPSTTLSAANRLHQAGSADAAIERIRAAAARAAHRRNGACMVGRPPTDLDRKWNALAGCACRKCSNQIALGLRRYTRVLISHAAPLLPQPEAESVCDLALAQALATWRGSGSFTKFYSRIAECALGETIRDTIAWDALERLDSPIVRGDAFTVTRVDRVPDRTIDVADIVIARDRIRGFLDAIRARRDAAVGTFQVQAATA